MDDDEERLNGFVVRVGNKEPNSDVDNAICGGMTAVPRNDAKITIDCVIPLIGRYVKLEIPPGENLHACEVLVMGVEAGKRSHLTHSTMMLCCLINFLNLFAFLVT